MTEQQSYDVVRATPDFELRRHPEHVVAETVVTDVSFEDAGSRAFRHLFRYITGKNTARQSIGLTTAGELRCARFDPPYTPWFLRRNEVLVDVVESD